jgi:hypothetical protein
MWLCVFGVAARSVTHDLVNSSRSFHTDWADDEMTTGDDKHWPADLNDEAIRRRDQTPFCDDDERQFLGRAVTSLVTQMGSATRR